MSLGNIELTLTTKLLLGSHMCAQLFFCVVIHSGFIRSYSQLANLPSTPRGAAC
jgi:hypothetical protein